METGTIITTPNRGGRPRSIVQTTVTSVRLPNATYDALCATARALGVDNSAVIRAAIDRLLAESRLASRFRAR